MTAWERGKARACERAKNFLSSDVIAERTLTVFAKKLWEGNCNSRAIATRATATNNPKRSSRGPPLIGGRMASLSRFSRDSRDGILVLKEAFGAALK